MQTWYYIENEKQVGPIPPSEFHALVSSGKITPQTLVWQDGMKNWTPYGSLAAGQDTGVCCECKKNFPLTDMVTYEGMLICAACKPVFFQRVQEGGVIPGRMVYGGFWIRFGAKFIDGIILGIVDTIFTTMLFLISGVSMFTKSDSLKSAWTFLGLQLLSAFVQIVLNGLYYVLFLGKYGATPGKMACGLKVVRSDGSKLTYSRAVGRYFSDMLSKFTFYIGYIIAAFDDEKRALHDRICDTRVIRNR